MKIIPVVDARPNFMKMALRNLSWEGIPEC